MGLRWSAHQIIYWPRRVAGVASVALLTACATRAPAGPPPAPTSTVTPSAASLGVRGSPTSVPPSPTIAPSSTHLAATRPPATATPRPRPSPTTAVEREPVVIERGTSGRREVALTFDAGSDRGNAEEILDLLAAEGIVATIGMTGQWAEANRGLVRRMVDDGHQLINHSWSHPSFTGVSTGDAPLPARERRRELERTNQAIQEMTNGDTRPYFRPPYGDYDDGVRADAAAAGYPILVMWSCDSLGWDGADPAGIVVRCGDRASAGDIILMHLGADSTDLDALPDLIASLRSQGFAFVTIARLLES